MIFEFPERPGPGAAYVNLDGYLICPVEMFSERQLKMAMKKYRLRSFSAGTC